jgi:hypothetical protein
MIQLTVLYGCETWAVTEQIKSAVTTWERKILRKIYGPIKDQNDWSIPANDELLAPYRKPNTVQTIKVRRREWAGHLVRISDDRTVGVKKVFLGKPDGRRKVGG